MSMGERRQSLLADTADVAEEDKIYLERLSGGGDMSPLRRKPVDLDDFLSMPGHTRPPRLDFANTGEMFETIKLAPPRVLQPSKTATIDKAAATMTIASILK